MKSYCIFCKSGSEQKVAEKINAIYKEFVVIVPKKVVTEKQKDLWIKKTKALIPGYVFLYQKDDVPENFAISEIDLQSESIDNMPFIDEHESRRNKSDVEIVWDAPKHSKVRVTDMYKILSNEDGYKELLYDDLQYANWILKHHGNFQPSKVLVDGEEVRIIDGPLLDFHGKILKIDKHKRRAMVEIEFDGQRRVISLGVELVRPCQD